MMVRTCSAVRPAKEGAEDTPALAVGRVLWVAAVEVPDVAADIVRAGTVARCTLVIDISTATRRMLARS